MSNKSNAHEPTEAEVAQQVERLIVFRSSKLCQDAQRIIATAEELREMTEAFLNKFEPGSAERVFHDAGMVDAAILAEWIKNLDNREPLAPHWTDSENWGDDFFRHLEPLTWFLEHFINETDVAPFCQWSSQGEQDDEDIAPVIVK